MPQPWKPEDRPGAVCFHLADKDGALEVTVSQLPQEAEKRYRVQGGSPRFASRDEFKARAIQMGFTPSVAEDPGRSFNATARQLRELGFDVALEDEPHQPAGPRM